MADPRDPAADDCTVVYHDGACPLCQREIAFMRDRDANGRLRFVDVTEGGAVLPDGMGRDAMLARFHVRGPDGRLRSGADAFATAWRDVRGLGWLGRIVSLPGLRLGFEGFYRIFLLVRPKMQRLVRAWDRR